MFKISKKNKDLFSKIIYKTLFFIIIAIILFGLYTLASRQRIGAECDDGWISRSIGSGTCSHHGGVENWGYTYWYNKDKVMPRSSINPTTKEHCDYGYNAIIKECCVDEDDYSCEVYENAPDGATAFCEDGTYDFKNNFSDSCLEHGGVVNDPQISPFIWN